jgi:hypothetical protein|tara:strand:+ start:1034 stop:1207 length:174 start_codon:yes stop_codon:yes gene_type:complete
MKKPEYKHDMADAEYSVFLEAVLNRFTAQCKGEIPADPVKVKRVPNKFLNPFLMISQ